MFESLDYSLIDKLAGYKVVSFVSAKHLHDNQSDRDAEIRSSINSE